MRITEESYATPQRATSSPPALRGQDRTLRLSELWKELPAQSRRDLLMDLTRLVAERLPRPPAEPEVNHEGR
jgi:hypothetical protein